jgi:hypothetical protein
MSLWSRLSREEMYRRSIAMREDESRGWKGASTKAAGSLTG